MIPSLKAFFKIRYLILLLLVVVFDSAFSQSITIHGTAENQPDELVRIIVYADQFSQLQETIASTKTDENGHFNFEIEVDKTTFAFIALGLKKAEFYLKPDAEYSFTIPLDTASRQGSIFDELPLQFDYQADDGGLSDAITKFNVAYNSFIYEYSDKIYRGRDKSIITDFRDKITSQSQYIDDPYYLNYIRYSFASLEWASKMKTNTDIIKEYFINDPILFQNIQYTDFFAEFFKSYFGYNQVFRYDELVDAINQGGEISALVDLINRDTLFKSNAGIRELIAAQLLARKYYSPDIQKDKVIGMFRELSEHGVLPEIREMASNYIVKLQKLDSGSPAPEFDLSDALGNPTNLQQFEGKFVLLSFVKPKYKMCLEHFQLLNELTKQFQNKLQNVTVVYGEPYRDVVKYATDRSFDWPILNLDKNILLLESYNIRAYPSYVLINPDGTISMATTPMPDENLELYIQRQISRFEKKQAAVEK